MKLKVLGMILVVLVLALTVGSLAFFNLSRQSEVESRVVSLRVGILPVMSALPFIIAGEEGLFLKHGLNVSLSVYGAARDRDAAFMAGLIDVMMIDPVTTLMLADKGVDVKIVALHHGEYSEDIVFYLLAPPDSQANIDTISSVAVSLNTVIEFAAWKIFEAKGRDPRSVNYIDIPSIPLRYQMLMEGKVEAAVLPDPWGTLAIVEGARLLGSTAELERTPAVSVVAMRGSLVDPEVVKRLRAALDEALGMYRANPEKYRSIVEERVFVPEKLKGKWLPTWKGRVVDYPRSLFNDVHVWLLERKLISKPLNYEDIVVVLGGTGA
ncbi:MAG: MetQ/NlpA family ABC transporter substrate-binding protein [Thermoprotei archaeon]|nr:MetQ/NlpA family ABC transporter substrate-binding protein [Thermoprotei archaeon]